MRKAIILLCLILVLVFSGCQSEIVNAQKEDWKYAKYLAVKDTQLGILELPEGDFDPLNVKIKAEKIVGMLDNNNVLVVGRPQDTKVPAFSSQLYRIKLEKQTVVPLVDNVEHACLSPDSKKVAFTRIDLVSKAGNSTLFYIDLKTNRVVQLSKNIIEKPWWAGDSSKILYTEYYGDQESSVILYDVQTGTKTELPFGESKNPIATGWLTESEILIRYALKNDPSCEVFASYNLQKNSQPVHMLFSNDVAEYVHDISRDALLVSDTKINSNSYRKILNVILANDPEQRFTIADVPLYHDDYGYYSAVFFRGAFISGHQVFYRVLTSENEDSVVSGIADIRAKARLGLDKNITDVWGPYKLYNKDYTVSAASFSSGYYYASLK